MTTRDEARARVAELGCLYIETFPQRHIMPFGLPLLVDNSYQSGSINSLVATVRGPNVKTRLNPSEVEIGDRTREIKLAMSALGRQLEAGDDSELLHWVVPNRLACAHRPLRHHPIWAGSGNILPQDATGLVFEWAERVLCEGIRSIISLMHDRDIRCYSSLELGAAGLLEFYKQQGFQVSHIPWEDPHHKKSSQ